MEKLISISVWGTNPRYYEGALKNIELAKTIYEGWNFKIFHDSSVPKEILKNFCDNGAETIDFTNKTKLSGHFWRFFAADATDQITIFRDSDSRLSYREKECVDEWILSDKKYSIIRDHIRHYDFPMLAGMWGIKGELTKQQLDKMLLYNNMHNYTVDQIYLAEHIWPEAKENSLIVGINESPLFREKRAVCGLDFVGQGYDEFDRPIYPLE